MGTFFQEVQGAGDPTVTFVDGEAAWPNTEPEKDASPTAKIAAKNPMRVRISGLPESTERAWLAVARALRRPVWPASALHIQSWRRSDFLL